VATRTDRQTLDELTLEPNGWLRASAALTRTGVFTYRNEDGSIRRELRPPQEVFRSDLMPLYAGLPLTVGHPDVFLDVLTTRAHQVGSISSPRREADKLVADLLITDLPAIEQVQRGVRQISVGYEAELDFTPGTWFGVPYDAVQRNIQPNHIAIVDRGRAGPECAIRLDQGDTMLDLEIDGNSVTVTPEMFSAVLSALGMDPANPPQTLELCYGPQDPAAAPTMDKAPAPAAPAPAAKADSLDALQARLDSMQAQLAAKPDETKIRESVRNRIKLESVAEAHGVRFDAAMSDDLLRAAVVKALEGVDVSAKSSAYIEARYDSAIEARCASEAQVRQAVSGTTAPDTAKRIDEAVQARRDAWKKPIPGAATLATVSK
jgi:hypothetical protein